MKESDLKYGDLIKCNSGDEAVKVSNIVMNKYGRFSEFLFHHDGEIGYWVVVGKKYIPCISPILCQISDFKFKTVKISKKIIKKLISDNLL